MADVHTKKQRAKNMAAIKSKGNKSTEAKFLAFLKTNKITGWRRNYKSVKGKPDFVFPKARTAIFLDGCFWHGCPKCYKAPNSNKEFWSVKKKSNQQRDKLVTEYLNDKGWKVIRIWEHELKGELTKGWAKEKGIMVHGEN